MGRMASVNGSDCLDSLCHWNAIPCHTMPHHTTNTMNYVCDLRNARQIELSVAIATAGQCDRLNYNQSAKWIRTFTALFLHLKHIIRVTISIILFHCGRSIHTRGNFESHSNRPVLAANQIWKNCTSIFHSFLWFHNNKRTRTQSGEIFILNFE